MRALAWGDGRAGCAVSVRAPLDAIRRAAAEVARAAGYRLVVLFGSAARGEGAPSDLDIGILATGPLDAVDATNRLIRALGMQEVDVADLGRAEPLLAALVAREAILLYERPGEFARFASLAVRRFADTRKFRDMEQRQIRDFVARVAERR